MRALAFALLGAVVGAACSASSGAFLCFSDEECVHAGTQGHCEQSGFCSFPDPSCANGSRYGDWAGDGLGGRCVPLPGDDLDAGPGAPDAAPLPACGTIGDSCCASGTSCLGTLACTSGTCGCAALGKPAAGAYSHHTCEVAANGSVWCWGSNSQGQMGTGSSGGLHTKALAVSALDQVTMVAAGATHSCAIAAGNVWCWGDNAAGQLGSPGADHPEPHQTSLSGATWISSAGSTTCALVGDQVDCWGHNDHGQVGDGSTSDRNKPKLVPNLSHVVAVTAAVNFSCALKDDATAWCWGAGDEGEMGDGQGLNSLVPVQVGLTNIAQIVGGDDQACARTTTGLVFCWGDNEFGTIGDGTNTQRRVPTQVIGLADVQEIDVADEFACARKGDGTVWCWGQNDVGQLGTGAISTFENTPHQVPGIDDATAIATGAKHACARRALGAIVCWGSNADGQLGDESTTSELQPTVVRLDCP